MSQATRSYFYEIDPAGYLYHDSTQLDDRTFLDFFFQRLRVNITEQFPEFSWVSPCGREMNFVRARETPIVFDRLIADEPHDMLGFNHTSLTIPFEPDGLRVSAHGGLFHPARPEAGIALGRLHTNLVLQLSANIAEEAGNYILTHRRRGNLILPISPAESLDPRTNPADSDGQ